MKYILKYLWALWNGAGFTFITGYGITNWQWWAFTMPMCFFVALSNIKTRKIMEKEAQS